MEEEKYNGPLKGYALDSRQDKVRRSNTSVENEKGELTLPN